MSEHEGVRETIEAWVRVTYDMPRFEVSRADFQILESILRVYGVRFAPTREATEAMADAIAELLGDES